jgi:hypothetical protein
VLGRPDLGEALLLMVGAVVAFVALEGVARGTLQGPAEDADGEARALGNARIPSAGTALCGVWGLVHLIHGPLGRALTGFVATAVYFTLAALQRVVVEAWGAKHG